MSSPVQTCNSMSNEELEDFETKRADERTEDILLAEQIERKDPKNVADVASSIPLAQTQISSITLTASQSKQLSERKTSESPKPSPATSTDNAPSTLQQESSATRKSQRVMARLSTSRSGMPSTQLCRETHQNAKKRKRYRKRKKITERRERQQIPFNAINPMYLEPFNYGWKRELVYRLELNSSKSDVYYYPPEHVGVGDEKQSRSLTIESIGMREKEPKQDGKTFKRFPHCIHGFKLRSRVDIAHFLNSSCPLTTENFTFIQQPLGINDPEKEIIRKAAKKTICPMHYEPFKHGWKRLVIYPCNWDGQSERKPNVFYYPPKDDEVDGGGQKARSVIRGEEGSKQSDPNRKRYRHPKLGPRLGRYSDIIQFLKPNSTLTTANFTFIHQPIGINDPEKEIIRTADWRRNIIAVESEDAAPLAKRIKRKSRKKVSGLASSIPITQYQQTHKSPATHSVPQAKLSKARAPKRIKSSLTTSTEQVPSTFQQESSATRRSLRAMARNSVSKSWKPPIVSCPAQDTSFATVTPTLIDYSTLESASTQNFDPANLDTPPLSESPIGSTTTERYIDNARIEGDWSQSQGQLDSLSSLSNKNFNAESGIVSIEAGVETKMESDIDIDDGKGFLIQANEDVVEKNFKFKVYIRKENDSDGKVQIRRFSIQSRNDFIYSHLCDTLQNYPDLVDENFTLHWTDSEGDDILVTTDIDLREAMEIHGDKLTKLNLTVLEQKRVKC